MSVVLRVQDREGRGPYRPGCSHIWADEHGTPLPTWMEEFGVSVLRHQRDGEAFGSGFKALKQCTRWFSKTECERLQLLGYSIVSLDMCRIIAESERQVVFARKMPFRMATTVIPWAALYGQSA